MKKSFISLGQSYGNLIVISCNLRKFVIPTIWQKSQMFSSCSPHFKQSPEMLAKTSFLWRSSTSKSKLRQTVKLNDQNCIGMHQKMHSPRAVTPNLLCNFFPFHTNISEREIDVITMIILYSWWQLIFIEKTSWFEWRIYKFSIEEKRRVRRRFFLLQTQTQNVCTVSYHHMRMREGGVRE